MPRDVDVERHSDALAGKRILFGITGGIAATEAVRISRELRRHGADLTVCMTPAATKVITPLAVGWASQAEVLEGWTAEMSQLDDFDAVLVCPASRNFLSRFVNGMMDHPLLMACSAARGRGTPILLVPSMHGDLFDDPVTGDLLERIEGATCLWGPDQEGRRKQPDPVQVVADLCHHVNRDSNSKRLAITLGANRAPIDAVRAIQSASSGRTGWKIAEHLHRRGHDVIVIAGKTSADPSFRLPDVRRAGGPDAMLSTCLKVADSRPEGWVHAAAVLDYYAKAESGKKASGAEEWVLTLGPGPKHIRELAPHVGDAKRIGFKLETGVSHSELEQAALNQIEQYGVDATIANLMEEMHDPSTPRAYLVTKDGMSPLNSTDEMCAAIEAVLIS